jgi:hypothetical protein
MNVVIIPIYVFLLVRRKALVLARAFILALTLPAEVAQKRQASDPEVGVKDVRNILRPVSDTSIILILAPKNKFRQLMKGGVSQMEGSWNGDEAE